MIDVIRTSNRLSLEDFDQLMTIESCEEKIQVLNEKILNRIYRIKSHIQSSNWNHLDNDEKIEQLIDINDTLFEQIVKEKPVFTWISFIICFLGVCT